MDMSLSKLQELVMDKGGLACCDSWGRRVGHDWATELNWSRSLVSLKLSLHCSYSAFCNCSVVQSLSCVLLFVTPWTTARQAFLSFTIS